MTCPKYIPEKVSLIEWPWSQDCMDCPKGKFVDIEDKPCTYICHWDLFPFVKSIPEDYPRNIPLGKGSVVNLKNKRGTG